MILVDVNIFMDIFERRDGWTHSLEIINKVKYGDVDGFISTLTIPILYFLRSRYISEKQAREDIRIIIKNFKTIPLTEKIINKSFTSDLPDFEDAIQFYSAEEANCVIIITRNVKDFENTKEVKVQTPEEFLKEFEGRKIDRN